MGPYDNTLLIIYVPNGLTNMYSLFIIKLMSLDEEQIQFKIELMILKIMI
jgi:hypothetical protein